MSDIVKQARHVAAEYLGSPLRAHREVSDVLSKCAAEIVRLRAEVTALQAAAWRAGRDAAEVAIRAAGFGGTAMTDAIRALQPPGDLAAATEARDAGD